MTSPSGRRYWLWVTGQQHYLVDGADNPDLAPPNAVEWTCAKDTKSGDLVLLYRTAPKSDIAYLLEVATDATVAWDGDFHGDYLCEAVSKIQFAAPLTLKVMGEDPLLRSQFGPLRARFRKRVFEIDPESWRHLQSLLIDQNPDAEQRVRELGRSSISRELRTEREIEDEFERSFESLDPGTGLELYSRSELDGSRRSGRQYRCENVGFIDLLGRDREGFVVVELKRGLVDKKAVGQILGYMGWVRENLAADGERVRGIIVGRELDAQAQYALNVIPDLSARFLDEFGQSD